MITLHDGGAYYVGGSVVFSGEGLPAPEIARKNTIAHRILAAHSKKDGAGNLAVTFDALVSHDITYVGILQTARASGMERFPLPYAMTCCHNSLCAVGGTINADDHAFGLSAARKYGGIFVPENLAVIHMYAREKLASCGSMILGSDSHTRYGALGTMGVGEGGPELVKQLLCHTYDIASPEVVLVHVTGAPKPGVGPHDVALALIAATFGRGFVKNKVLEFVGPGIRNLSADFRCGVDVMTTETACLSSIWETDNEILSYYEAHGRPEAFEQLSPRQPAYYDAVIELDLSAVECMIALPFHPSNAYPIRTLNENAADLLNGVEREAERLFGKGRLDLASKLKNHRVHADQGVIAGCAGGLFDNLCDAAAILSAGSCSGFSLSVYPGSAPVELALMENGVLASLLRAGAIAKPAFCGPCFGAGDVPQNNGLSVRHTTRNFVNREGSRPDGGQLAAVALMDARSIAATALAGGAITAATELDVEYPKRPYRFDPSVYNARVYNGFANPKPDEPLVFGPNIADWPAIPALGENLLLELAAVIRDPVTTTDELIPSGETSSYRSNPEKLASFTLSRRAPDYVPRSRAVRALEAARQSGEAPAALVKALSVVSDTPETLLKTTQFASCIFAEKPGDGSAREQAASCQRVLGGAANICREFATKRYRSNCVNWGILPFTIGAEEPFPFEPGDLIFIPGVRAKLIGGADTFPAKAITARGVTDIVLRLPNVTPDERELLIDGCLMNYYKNRAHSA